MKEEAHFLLALYYLFLTLHEVSLILISFQSKAYSWQEKYLILFNENAVNNNKYLNWKNPGKTTSNLKMLNQSATIAEIIAKLTWSKESEILE